MSGTRIVDDGAMERRLTSRLAAIAGHLIDPFEGRLDSLTSRLDAVGGAMGGFAPMDQLDRLASRMHTLSGVVGEVSEQVAVAGRQQERMEGTLRAQQAQLARQSEREIRPALGPWPGGGAWSEAGPGSSPGSGRGQGSGPGPGSGRDEESVRAIGAVEARLTTLERRVSTVAAVAGSSVHPAPTTSDQDDIREDIYDLQCTLQATIADVASASTSLNHLHDSLDDVAAARAAADARCDTLEARVDRAWGEATTASLQVFALENKCDAGLDRALALSASNATRVEGALHIFTLLHLVSYTHL